MPSYTGTSIDKKPAKLKRNEKFHKLIADDFVPTIEQVISAVNQWLNFHYSQPFHYLILYYQFLKIHKSAY